MLHQQPCACVQNPYPWTHQAAAAATQQHRCLTWQTLQKTQPMHLRRFSPTSISSPPSSPPLRGMGPGIWMPPSPSGAVRGSPTSAARPQTWTQTSAAVLPGRRLQAGEAGLRLQSRPGVLLLHLLLPGMTTHRGCPPLPSSRYPPGNCLLDTPPRRCGM